MLLIGKYLFLLFAKVFKKNINHQHFGTHYGGWKIPLASIQNTQHLYSAGVGEDLSFEVEFLLANKKCDIFLYDPTPIAVTHVEKFLEKTKNNHSFLINGGKKRHPQDKENETYPLINSDLIEMINFDQLGWSEKEKTLKFYEPPLEGMVSYSTEGKSDKFIEFKCKPVSDIVKENQTEINENSIIKMDIEGSEYGVIKDLFKNKLNPGLLLFEIHIYNIKNVFQVIHTAVLLFKNNYRCYYVDGDNFGFIKN